MERKIEIDTPYIVCPIEGTVLEEGNLHLFIEDEVGVIYKINKNSITNFTEK